MLLQDRSILIVSASIGAGHNQAAKAIQNEILRQDPTVLVRVVDFIDGDNSYLNNLIKEAYLKMIEIVPNIYDFLYRWSQVSQRGAKVQNLMMRILKKSMLDICNEYHPDVVIFTHPFPCGAAAYLRRTGQINIPIMGVITDFAVHRMWVYNEVDLYFVASAELKDRLIQDNIDADRVMVSGIPIDYSFRATIRKKNARKELRLDTERPAILLMGGGLGLGPVKEALRSLNQIKEVLEIVVVAGKNMELQQSLTAYARRSHHRIRVLGFTDKIAVLMAAADLLITKPGALTSSEALAMELPMVFYKPLPGQEEENAAYLASNGAAIWVKSRSELNKTLVNLLAQDRKQLQLMKLKARLLKRPGAAPIVSRAVKYCIARTGQNRISMNMTGGK